MGWILHLCFYSRMNASPSLFCFFRTTQFLRNETFTVPLNKTDNDLEQDLTLKLEHVGLLCTL